MSINPSCDKSEDASEAGDEGKEYGDMVLCEGPLSLAIEDVLDVRFCVLELVVAKGKGEVTCPWGRGVASGDEGVFGAGRGDMRAVAETNGDAKEPDLLRKRKRNQIKSYKIEAQKIVTTMYFISYSNRTWTIFNIIKIHMYIHQVILELSNQIKYKKVPEH